MKLAVLLMSCSGSARTTNYDRNWVQQVVGHVADYYSDQTGGRVKIEFKVLDWFQLPQTSQQWNDLEFGAGPVVKQIVATGLGVDLSAYDHFALVIDKFDATSAAVSPSNPEFVHVGAQSLDPALLQHEFGHFFGAGHANLDTPAKPVEYGDQYCIMGAEGSKHSFVHTPLNRQRPDGSIDVALSDSGPGMAAPSLRACGWLDLSAHGIDITAPLQTGTRRTTVELAPLRGAPAGAGKPVVAFADGVLADQRLLLEFRSQEGWDVGMPTQGVGWVVAHLTGLEDRSRMSLQVGVVEASPGASIVTSRGAVLLNVAAASPQGVTLVVELMAPVPVDRRAPAVASWGVERLDVFGVGLDDATYHKAWAQAWFPSPVEWEPLGGGFTAPLAVESWGPERLDVFGIGADQAMWHKAWAQAWFPSQHDWEPIGGKFISQPAVASWGPDRLDIFGIGLDRAMFHKAWAQRWFPSQHEWEPLGGKFISQPAVASWGPDRLDVFGVGLDKAMFHKAWAQGWHPSPEGWEYLGGSFTSPPAVCSWGPERLDVFALGLDRSLWHKAWANGWFPSQHDWEPLGGKFVSPPAAVSWGDGRIDVFGIGLDGAIYHRAWKDGWHPWESLGGVFTSPPSAVSWGTDRIDIFAVGKDGGMYHKAWAGGWFPSRDGWEALSGGFR